MARSERWHRRNAEIQAQKEARLAKIAARNDASKAKGEARGASRPAQADRIGTRYRRLPRWARWAVPIVAFLFVLGAILPGAKKPASQPPRSAAVATHPAPAAGAVKCAHGSHSTKAGWCIANHATPEQAPKIPAQTDCAGDGPCEVAKTIKAGVNAKLKDTPYSVRDITCLQDADPAHFKCDAKFHGAPEAIYNATADPSTGEVIWELSSGGP